MSYTGESYNGTKYLHTIASAGTILRLDNIIVEVNNVSNNWRIKIKTVTGGIAVFGVCNYYQGATIYPDSAYSIGVGNGSYYEFFSTPFVRAMSETGCVQELYFRTNASAYNQGIYHLCAIAGVGSSAPGFDKISLTIKRL
jgi:hypothetical protein